jgi:hypothetical protein
MAYQYSSPFLSTGDPQWMLETSGKTKLYTHYVFPYLYAYDKI